MGTLLPGNIPLWGKSNNWQPSFTADPERNNKTLNADGLPQLLTANALAGVSPPHSAICAHSAEIGDHWAVVQGQAGAQGRDILSEATDTSIAVSHVSVLAELGPYRESRGSSKSTVGDGKGLSWWD